jgi:glycosyltransferase involved in cell wall biosynthesis
VSRLPKVANTLRLVYLSRLVRIKNLDYVLRLLRDIPGHVVFHVYGPVEDWSYWGQCEELAGKLPPNIEFSYCGEVAREAVVVTLARDDLFILPTHGENFGYVVLESLAAGCPVLISDQTPWHGLEGSGVGWEIPLSAPQRFRQVISRCLQMTESEHRNWSARARAYAAAYQREQQERLSTMYNRLFSSAVEA